MNQLSFYHPMFLNQNILLGSGSTLVLFKKVLLHIAEILYLNENDFRNQLENWPSSPVLETECFYYIIPRIVVR